MRKPRLTLIRAVPGTTTLKPILDTFGRQGPAIVTAFSEGKLRVIRSLLDPDGEVEVSSFSDVVGQFLAVSGGFPLPLALRGFIEASIVDACSGLTDESPFYETRNFGGFHKRLGSVLEELRAWNCDPAKLDTLAAEASIELAGKLASLAQVDREVRDLTSRIGRQLLSERIRDCIEIEPESAHIHRLLIVAGSHDQPLWLEWIRWVADSGVDVTVYLEGHSGNRSLFEGANIIESQFDTDPIWSQASNALSQALFVPDKFASSDAFEAVIASMSDPLAEAEWTLRSCIEDIAHGTPPTRIAICARDLESYAPLLDIAAKRLGVPIKLSRRIPLLTNSLARLMLQALQFCASDDVRLLRPVFRSTYMALKRETIKSLDVAVRDAYASKSDQWNVLADWVSAHKEEFPWLQSLLEWRSICLANPADLAEWTSRLQELGEQPWHEAAVRADTPTGNRDLHAENAMQRSLAAAASVDKVRGKGPLTLRHFVNLCRRLWSDAEMTLPGAETGIGVCQSAEEIGDVDCLYVLGMLEGVFPRRRSEDPVLTDSDRKWLSEKIGGTPLLDSYRRAREERDEFFRVCAAPRDKLVLCYPLTDDERDNVPAFYLKEVERVMGPRLRRQNHPRSTWTPDVPIAESDKAMQVALAATREDPLPNLLKTDEAAETIRGVAGRSFRVDDLRDVLRCPFQFLSYRCLDLRANRPTSRWNRLRTLPVKAKLADQATRESATTALELQLENELSSLYGEASSDDLTLMKTGGRRLIREWVEREFDARTLWKRDSVETNHVGFSSGPLRKTLKVDNDTITLEGDVPAISRRGAYSIIHSFKAHDPWGGNGWENEPRAWLRLREQDQFEFALFLTAMRGLSDGLGIEFDSSTGIRRLILLPRGLENISQDHKHGFYVNAVEGEHFNEMRRFVGAQVETAVRRIRTPIVEPTPGDPCRYCEQGELCRRSSEYGEEGDPFMTEDGDFDN